MGRLWAGGAFFSSETFWRTFLTESSVEGVRPFAEKMKGLMTSPRRVVLGT
jgi:hypothetical protein